VFPVARQPELGLRAIKAVYRGSSWIFTLDQDVSFQPRDPSSFDDIQRHIHRDIYYNSLYDMCNNADCST
jgi:hypothetical protein